MERQRLSTPRVILCAASVTPRPPTGPSTPTFKIPLASATAEAADGSPTLHRSRIHRLRHPLLLQFCKSSLQRGAKVEERVLGKVLYTFAIERLMRLTFAAKEVLLGAPGSVVTDEGLAGAVRGVDAVAEAADALLPQQPHEELQADEGEHAEAEDGQDHHVCQLPHRLDQSAHDGFQTFGEEDGTGRHIWKTFGGRREVKRGRYSYYPE